MRAVAIRDPLTVALACGGTGGHIFPGLATAQALRDRGHHIELYLAGKDVESEAVKDWDGVKHVVHSQGFQRRDPFHVAHTLYKLRRAQSGCRHIMRRSRPDVLLGMGSYACVGPVRAAQSLGVPYVLHEANVYPGRAVTALARGAAAVAACFEETRHYLQKVDLAVTGMPLRPELWAASRAASEERGRDDGRPFTLLVTGGSRGATALNRAASAAVVQLARHRRDFFVIHLAGRNDEDEVRAMYERESIPSKVRAFVNDMMPIYRAADLAVCRSGASTCAEIAAFGVPALLVPLPTAVRDHQTANAKAMERMGCADFVPESDLESTWLSEYIDGCMHSPERLGRMRAAARKQTRRSGAEALADVVEQVAVPA